MYLVTAFILGMFVTYKWGIMGLAIGCVPIATGIVLLKHFIGG